MYHFAKLSWFGYDLKSHCIDNMLYMILILPVKTTNKKYKNCFKFNICIPINGFRALYNVLVWSMVLILDGNSDIDALVKVISAIQSV